MKAKNVALASVKAGPQDGMAEGEFTGYASVFGNIDSYGDKVMPGAFTKTLAEWQDSGNPIPLLWGHNMTDPDYNVGTITDAVEDEKGLLVTGKLDMESPKSQQVYRLMKGKRVNQMSFAYDVIDGGPTQKSDDSDAAYELRELKLYEVSIVPIGANQETELLAVKSNAEALFHAAKEGRVLAAKHITSLKAAVESLSVVIEAAEGTTDQEKASGKAPAKDEEPAGVKSEEPTPNPSVESLDAIIHFLEKDKK